MSSSSLASLLTTTELDLTNAPATLLSVFVVLTFHWDTHKLALLRLAVTEVADWPTKASVLIVTNQHKLLSKVVTYWDTDDLQVTGVLNPPLHHRYDLVWEQRAYDSGEAGRRA